MDENLVGYLLNALDPEAQREVENSLQDNPQARQRLDLLRQALEPLAADRDPIEPPAGLAERTLVHIAAEIGSESEGKSTGAPGRTSHAVRSVSPLPAFSREASLDRRWWRRADVLVAAGLLLAVLGFGFPWLVRVRHQHHILECQNNLRVFHQALVGYSMQHQGDFPRVDLAPPRNVAGIFVPMLHDAGLLGPDVSVRCPANGPRLLVRWSLPELEVMPVEEFNRRMHELAGCYAYSLGYRDPAGHYHGLRRDSKETDNDFLPVLADRPQLRDIRADSTGRGNSPNHGGGQNVLYVGGHVRFCTDRTVGVGGDDIFTNRDRRIAAGLDRLDSVLGASGDQP